ncbi:MBL fold metallo-hydrolase, partial [Myxococcota bacterium]|nr:MBL fold metallo-hydrolase [Myxococcota bacterium]
MNRRALSLLLLTLLSAWACPVVAAPIDAPRAARLKGALGEIKAPAATVRFIDVDQGDATLISIDGKHVLIDSGPPKAADGLVRDLRAWGVTQIDLLINTHAHADHIGGAAKLIEAIPVKAALDPGVIHPSSAYKKMLKALEDHQIPVRQARAGREIKIGSARLKILAPKDPLFTGTRSDHNANSVVTRLDVGGVRFLFMGDAEAETEERLI